ncbi:MAG: hypothetical protein QGG36_27650 [Pirellulaceae bacterium]|jgi:hypothetical protein|nr:hypothetical protein [Pirellulaceae bacterium]MDP7019603.1 hypothetical protein [Pirellulaceae bacterium]
MRWAFAVLIAFAPAPILAQQTTVPPADEIEVLDPGVDPTGKPAVLLRPGGKGDELRVEIPPTVLVHRYYYSGNRKFQGPPLPGGPSILVVNHPRTGERCYIPAQMKPGAPVVHYSQHGIAYEYPDGAITLHFGLTGKPTIRYRNGKSIRSTVARATHWNEVKHVVAGAKNAVTDLKTKTGDVVVGMSADVSEFVESAAYPATNLLQMAPFGKAIFGGDLGSYFTERADQVRRDQALKRAQRERERNQRFLRTNR